MNSKWILLIIANMVCTLAFARGEHAGRLIKKSGKVELFLNPSSKVQGPGPHVKFQGLFYNVKKNPRLGFKIPNGSVIKTGAKSKARIVYKNGDQFNVGEGTSYKIQFAKSGFRRKGATTVNLLYGKLRAVISKKGPRNNMKIKTNSAVMGIRGTDFYVSKKSSLKGAEVAVLRGMVEMKPKARKAKAVKIKTGFTAAAPAPKIKIKSRRRRKKLNVDVVAAVKLQQTSKQELVQIQKQSVIKKEEMSKEDVKDLKKNKRVARVLQKLEKKAVENTLDDIKQYDPEMYRKLKSQKVANVDQINTNVVKKVFKKAPDRPLKPGLDDLEEDVYDKYFSIE
jgi:hypothetical protein